MDKKYISAKFLHILNTYWTDIKVFIVFSLQNKEYNVGKFL